VQLVGQNVEHLIVVVGVTFPYLSSMSWVIRINVQAQVGVRRMNDLSICHIPLLIAVRRRTIISVQLSFALAVKVGIQALTIASHLDQLALEFKQLVHIVLKGIRIQTRVILRQIVATLRLEANKVADIRVGT